MRSLGSRQKAQLPMWEKIVSSCVKYVGWMAPGVVAKSTKRRVVSFSLQARPLPPSCQWEIWAVALCAKIRVNRTIEARRIMALLPKEGLI